MCSLLLCKHITSAHILTIWNVLSLLAHSFIVYVPMYTFAWAEEFPGLFFYFYFSFQSMCTCRAYLNGRCKGPFYHTSWLACLPRSMNCKQLTVFHKMYSCVLDDKHLHNLLFLVIFSWFYCFINISMSSLQYRMLCAITNGWCL